MVGAAVKARVEEVQQKLQAHGYTRTALGIDGIGEASASALVDVLQTLLTQHEEEVQLRERLLAQNEALESQVQRTQRLLAQEQAKREHAETKANQAKVKLQCVEAAGGGG